MDFGLDTLRARSTPRGRTERDEKLQLVVRSRVGAGFRARANIILADPLSPADPQARVSAGTPRASLEPPRATQLQFLHRFFFDATFLHTHTPH